MSARDRPPHTIPVARVVLPREGVVTHRVTPGGSGVVDIHDDEGHLMMALHLPLSGEMGRTILKHLSVELAKQETLRASREHPGRGGAAM